MEIIIIKKKKKKKPPSTGTLPNLQPLGLHPKPLRSPH